MNFFSIFNFFFVIFQLFWNFIQNGQNQQKILTQPYEFFVFESRNLHSRAESVWKRILQEILNLGQKRQKYHFSKKKLHFEIWAWNIYNQSSKNQQVNLIARAKLGSHPRSRHVYVVNLRGSSKESRWDPWFLKISKRIFVASVGALPLQWAALHLVPT